APAADPRAHLPVLALWRADGLPPRREADPAALLHGVPRRVDLPLLRRGAPVEEPGRHHGEPGVGGDGALRRPPLARRELRRAPGLPAGVVPRAVGAGALRGGAAPPSAARTGLDPGRPA